MILGKCDSGCKGEFHRTLDRRVPPVARKGEGKARPRSLAAASAGLGSKPVVGNLWDLRPADASGWIQAYAAGGRRTMPYPPRLQHWPTTERPP